MTSSEQGTHTQAELLAHAQRQTKALENINFVLMALFVLGLVAFGALLIL